VPSMLRALSVAGRLRPDAVLLVRGGGARTDLAPFDDERLARAVARSPVPVVAGVGHEIDSTVADEVAHTSAKTPTAAAAAVVALLARALERAEAAWAGVVRRGTTLPAAATAALDRKAAAVQVAARLRLSGEAARLDGLGRRVDGRRQLGRLDRLDASLVAARSSVGRAVDRHLERAERDLAGWAAVATAADPARALARGFSVTRTADGRLLRAPDEVAAGDGLVTTLAGGALRSTVAEEAS
jgi:exodeoxyribonuclease VII large subunit